MKKAELEALIKTAVDQQVKGVGVLLPSFLKTRPHVLRFGGGNMNKLVCGATTRNGTPCEKAPFKNGRCRLHGGKSTGPKNRKKKSDQMKGNKHALKTGEYETISFDTLSAKEKSLYNLIPEDPLDRLKGHYKMSQIRQRRLMLRVNEERQKNQPNEALILKIEKAIDRIDGRSIDLLKEQREIIHHSKDDESNDSLGQLVEILEKARQSRKRI
ncbi:HGGxSTG domain-containing protein (plasmid) [Bacillus cabrialesii]|uniref:HGGxSTG domain-containing protein n=1 Tax=Bacillus cabrialesii TaxID=2487276 RepID=UPI003CF4B773